ncbi:hypothetical protein C8J57DRAFT_1226142 [Mycena rebaudengoi]|nr:hypothetical protein C8J57DRAFT_1226142 [Mycena rebaudengoi]
MYHFPVGRAPKAVDRVPPEIIAHTLSFVDEYDLPLSIEESVRFRGLLRLALPSHVDSVPCLWARMLITPTTQISQLLNWLDLSRSYALDVHIRAPSARLYYPSDHDGFTLFRHFRHLIQLLSTRFSTCTKLVLEINNIGLVRIAMEELKVANPAILTAMSVVMENEYHSFANFQPSCLANFVFPIAPAFGQPFLPISRLSIVGAGVHHPVFTHTASSTSMSIVQLPHQYSLAWLDLIHLLTSSISLHHLILDAVRFLPSHPGTMIASPPVHICVLEVTFRGLQLMADILAHIPFPYLTTLKVHFYNESDTQCLASCSSILNTVEELILVGDHPVKARVLDVFRFCMRVEILDMRQAEEEFFESFWRASDRLPIPGFDNYNACPLLHHLIFSRVSLYDIQGLLETRVRMGYANVLVVTALEARDVDAAIILWFQTQATVFFHSIRTGG